MERLPSSVERPNVWLSAAYQAASLEDLQQARPQLIQDAIEGYPDLLYRVRMMQGMALECMHLFYQLLTKNDPDREPFYFYGIEVHLPGIYHTPARDDAKRPETLRLFDRLDGVSTYLDVTPFPDWQKLLISNLNEFSTNFQELKAQRWGPSVTLLNAIYCPLFPDKFKLIGTEDIPCPQKENLVIRLPDLSSSRVATV